ncbi:cholinesterase 1 [Aplysia californica]|uniref:Carboxylic ester hydrolase n=1 Tax=Aplysia californica TaxID=6500 RepID=A0ABM0JE54_APLCA|nr:cholinesterase 1 [Aplysia californica]
MDKGIRENQRPILMCLFPLFILAGAVEAVIPQSNYVSVLMNHGQEIRGTRETLKDGRKIDVFRGIPYAEPPTGQRRFKAPVESAGWSGTKYALHEAPRCLQSITPKPGTNESEDCLFLDVLTPGVNGSSSSSSYPVMVWIHGGAFLQGGAYKAYGSSMAATGVVVVAMNYRLGPFGFLSTGDDVMPGNYGMLDQLLALKWVQKYVHVFGGDPSHVTIAGHSAGSASVSFHVLSPLSVGLFQRAIMMSGFSLCPWTVERPGTKVSLKEFTTLLGKEVGCTESSSKEMFICLQNANANAISNATFEVQKHKGVQFLASPRVENTFGFLPKDPLDIFLSGNFSRVDTIRGFASGEWPYFIYDPDDDGISRDDFKPDYEKFQGIYAYKNSSYITNIVSNSYLGNTSDPIAVRTQLFDALLDTLFAAPAVMEIEQSLWGSNSGKHYLYQFSYRASDTVTPAWEGVSHYEEIAILQNRVTDPADRSVALLTESVVSNFVKTGNPTATRVENNGEVLQWEPFTSSNPALLNIDSKASLQKFPRLDKVPFYKTMLDALRETSSG